MFSFVVIIIGIIELMYLVFIGKVFVIVFWFKYFFNFLKIWMNLLFLGNFLIVIDGVFIIVVGRKKFFVVIFFGEISLIGLFFLMVDKVIILLM